MLQDQHVQKSYRIRSHQSVTEGLRVWEDFRNGPDTGNVATIRPSEGDVILVHHSGDGEQVEGSPLEQDCPQNNGRGCECRFACLNWLHRRSYPGIQPRYIYNWSNLMFYFGNPIPVVIRITVIT